MNIHFVLMRKFETYLLAQARTSLLNTQHALSCTNIFLKREGQRPVRANLPTIIDNIDEMNISSNTFTTLTETVMFVDPERVLQIPQADLYCFSCYDVFLSDQITVALYLQKKYPTAKFLFGGIEISLNERTRLMLSALGFLCSTSDIGTAMTELTSNVPVSNAATDLSKKTISDMPIFLPQELEYLNYNIILNTIQGCPNACKFCPSGVIPHSMIPVDIVASWIKKYEKAGVKKISINDPTFNLTEQRLNDMLDALISQNNAVQLTVLMSPKFITPETIKKLKKANILNIWLGGDSLSFSDMTKNKATTYDEFERIVDGLVNEKLNVKISYIVGLPGVPEDSAIQDADFLLYLSKKHESLKFKGSAFNLKPGTAMSEKPRRFGITLVPQNVPPSKTVPALRDIFNDMLVHVADAADRESFRRMEEILDNKTWSVPFFCDEMI